MSRYRLLNSLTSDVTRLRDLVHASGIGLWEHDHSDRCSVWSSGIWALLDLPSCDDPVDWMAYVHPDDRIQLEATLGADASRQDAEFRLRRANDEWVWVRKQGRVTQQAADGRPLRSGGTLVEISDCKRLQQALVERDERLRLVTDAITEVFYIADAAVQQIFFVSPAYERIWQQPVAELYRNPRAFLDAIHADDRPSVLKALDTHAEGWPFEQEYRIVRPDGSLRWIWDRGFPVLGADGAVEHYVGLAQDITERKEAEQEVKHLNAELEARVAQRTSELQTISQQLQKREQLYRTIVEAAQEGIWMIDAAAVTSFSNARMAEMLGCSVDDMVGQSLFAFMDEEWRLIAETNLARRTAGVSEQHDFKFRRKDGTALWSLVSTHPLYDEQGRYAGAAAMVTDITERLKADEAVRRLQHDQELILNSVPALIYYKDTENRILRVNAAVCQALGLPREQIEGQSTAALFPDEADRYYRDDRVVIESGLPQLGIEEPHQSHPGAEKRWIRTDKVPLKDASGRVMGVLVMAMDVTERKRAEDALRVTEEDLNRAQAVARIGSWRLDVRRDVLTWSAENHRLFGIPAGMAMNYETFLSVVHPEDRDYVNRMWESALTGQPYDIEHRIIVDGRVKWVREKAEMEFDESGNLLGGFGTTQDITQRKLAEQALREADRRKDEFLATLAHELRNPLAPIKSSAEVLRMQGIDDATRTWCAEVIERQAAHLSHLVDDLMDVSRISRGKINLNKCMLSAVEIVERAVETSRPLIEERTHALSMQLPPAPLRIEGDPVRLAQVVSNLLNNAANYTDPGGQIAIRVERDGSDAVIRVKDNGIGLPPEMIDHVFDMFAQVDRSLDRSQGGLGIGLSLARQLVALHGGTIAAHSDGEGTGSEFVVRLPLAHAQEPDIRPRQRGLSEDTPGRRRILIADDNIDAGDSLAMLLRGMGHDVRVARDGLESLHLAEEFCPHFILMDIGMPKLDGYEACRRIRDTHWGQAPVIVALTGWGQDGDRARSREAGFTHHLTKPVDLNALRRMLDALGHGTDESP